MNIRSMIVRASLAWLILAGGRVYALGDLRVHHNPPTSLRTLIRKTIWYERGNAQVARKHPESGYRIQLRSPWHAAAYLTVRTVALLPLMALKVSYHQRRPKLTFGPVSAFLSYLGAWVYCLSWFAEARRQRGGVEGVGPLTCSAFDASSGGSAQPVQPARQVNGPAGQQANGLT